MPAKRREVHWYAVYMSRYENEATKAGVERKEEYFLVSGRTFTEVFYSDTSRIKAERAFTRACLVMMNDPLAFETALLRDGQTLIVVEAKRSS